MKGIIVLIAMISMSFLILSGCENTSDVNQKSDHTNVPDDTENTEDLEEQQNLAQDIKISGCGGFQEGKTAKLKHSEDEVRCDQLIVWDYDEKSKRLNIANINIYLNCCGEHSVEIFETDGFYEYTMIDNTDDGSRCACMCFFDYSAAIENITGNTTNLFVYRITEEEENRRFVWTGSIDISEGSGTITVKPRSGLQCM